VTGRTRREVELKARSNCSGGRSRRAARGYARRPADAKEQAQLDTEAALAAIEEHRSILAATLDVDDRLNWRAMKATAPFGELVPTLAEIRAELSVSTERRFIERLSKKALSAREEAEQKADEVLAERRRTWRSAALLLTVRRTSTMRGGRVFARPTRRRC